MILLMTLTMSSKSTVVILGEVDREKIRSNIVLASERSSVGTQKAYGRTDAYAGKRSGCGHLDVQLIEFPDNP